jgi:hypothetical protein
MIIKEIRNITPTEFEELHNIYVSTFPLENAKQLDIYINHIYDMLRNDSRYHLYAAVEDRVYDGYLFVIYF